MSHAYSRWHQIAGVLFKPARLTDSPRLACVIPAESGGWILEKTAQMVANAYPGEARLVRRLYPVAAAEVYLFLHYHWAIKALRTQPWLRRKKLFAFYTHPSDERIDPDEFVSLANSSVTPICMCEPSEAHLLKAGVRRERIRRVFGAGADPELFAAPVRESQSPAVLGICSAYYPRKRPELSRAVAELMPDVTVRVLGPGWQEWSGYQDFAGLPNVRFETRDYEEYPEFYRSIRVFLSASEVEGGPVPLIEAMMSNAVPVVSDTGFARELIKDRENGFIFPVDARPPEIVSCIRQALAMSVDVRSSVVTRTWESFGLQMARILGGESADREMG